MIHIQAPNGLVDFRRCWNGSSMLKLLKERGGRLLVSWDLGVGKSHCIDQVIEEAVGKGLYDLVVVFSPTRQVLEERRWIRQPPGSYKIINLKARPTIRCGKSSNLQWLDFEQNGLGALGKVEICKNCSSREICNWPDQFGSALKGSQVIFCTQAHLERTPFFLDQVCRWVGVHFHRVLAVLDESTYIVSTAKRRIELTQLQRFLDVLQEFKPDKEAEKHKKWVYLCELLINATTKDLRDTGWNFPWMNPEWALLVQKLGYEKYGTGFTFLAYDLAHFGVSSYDTREKEAGVILYSNQPRLGKTDFMIFSGAAHHRFTEYRLDMKFDSPFDDYLFFHPNSRWYNISIPSAARSYFKKNSPQILDFFAGMVVRRLGNGHRPLLVAKKCFVSFCVKEMNKRLKELGCDAQVVSRSWTDRQLIDPLVVPIIHFGVIGVNLFENFDCAFCLTGFYVDEKAVHNALFDLRASNFHLPIRLGLYGEPKRRRAERGSPDGPRYIEYQMAQLALEHLEMGTVIQAVGRVRPYTTPCEIITLECHPHPRLEYTREFRFLSEARLFFGVPGRRERLKTNRREQVQHLKNKGLTQKEAARVLGIGERTAKRYWR